MCFSPEASFTGGIIILAIGVATIKTIHKPSQIVFASIPLFFGIQQITEGILWVTLSNPEFEIIQKVSTYFFLLMAQALWPIIIPFSVLFMEENKKKIRTLKLLLALGFIISLYYSYCLLNFSVNPQILNYHIIYYNDFPSYLANYGFALYLIATISPLFVSSIPKTYIMGILLFFSCLITGIFFTQYLTSVWCFFAAILSGIIYWILKDSEKAFKLKHFNVLIKRKEASAH